MQHFLSDPIAEKRPRAMLIMYDACRTDEAWRPAASASGRPLRGDDAMADPRLPTNGMLFYACGPGETASDGAAGGNGAFTASILKHVTAAVPVHSFTARTMRDLRERTGQEAYTTGRIEDEALSIVPQRSGRGAAVAGDGGGGGGGGAGL